MSQERPGSVPVMSQEYSEVIVENLSLSRNKDYSIPGHTLLFIAFWTMPVRKSRVRDKSQMWGRTLNTKMDYRPWFS